MLDSHSGRLVRLLALPDSPVAVAADAATHRLFLLSAGQAVEWLRDDLGIIERAADSDALAAQVADTGDVWFVPALI